jgi:hypothetical protein
MGGSAHSEHNETCSTHRQLSRTTTKGHMDLPADFDGIMRAGKMDGAKL